MKLPNENLLKDNILNYLFDKKDVSTTSISSHFKVDIFFVYYCVDDLIDNGFISFIDASSKDTDKNEKIINIEPYGRFFLNQSGGYKKSHSQYKREKTYTILKTVMTATSTLAIIILTYLNFKATDKANDNSKTIDNLNYKIDSLNQTIQNIYSDTSVQRHR